MAEQPELHLLPHLERACESLPFELLDGRSSDDDVYDVRLAWTGGEAGICAIRATVFALLGAISEPATYVRQRRTERDATLMFEVVTGIVDKVPFDPHGHTLRLSVSSGLR